MAANNENYYDPKVMATLLKQMNQSFEREPIYSIEFTLDQMPLISDLLDFIESNISKKYFPRDHFLECCVSQKKSMLAIQKDKPWNAFFLYYKFNESDYLKTTDGKRSIVSTTISIVCRDIDEKTTTLLANTRCFDMIVSTITGICPESEALISVKTRTDLTPDQVNQQYKFHVSSL